MANSVLMQACTLMWPRNNFLYVEEQLYEHTPEDEKITLLGMIWSSTVQSNEDSNQYYSANYEACITYDIYGTPLL